MLYFAKWKTGLVLAICLAGLFFSVPNALRGQADALPSWWQPVTLGLDLQGGSYLLLEVETKVVVQEQLEALVENARAELRTARIRYVGLGVEGESAAVTIPDAGQRAQARTLLAGLDTAVEVTEEADGRFVMGLTEQALIERRSQAVDQSIEIVRKRVDETGTREPTIQRQGENRIIVELPGVDDPQRIKDLIGRTAKLNFHLVDERVSAEDMMSGQVPPGTVILPAAPNNAGGPQSYPVRKRIEVSGDRLVDAQASFQDSQPVVSFRFDTAGGSRFGRVTQESVGQNLAIVLDNQVISAPVIREPILGGSGVISGRFSVQEVQDLALLLRAGALPAPLTVLEERTVGPGLGADSIEAGALASGLGFVLVVVFMLASYGLFGGMAVVALFVNLFLLLGSLSLLGATLTLPGIAGIVLTMGMAVDANVLIFERMREETRNGRTLMNSIETGFRQAFKAIVDANVTTLVAAGLLFYFGSGPVKGFAVTLSLGIVSSMFTAVMVTRLMVVTWLRRGHAKTLPI
ncbi:protein translocase subunit SecD [Roseospira marina]|uniref:Protein translocase subunit SecD n=1 Tax=Roseospira marina TaxID=140057 RepID=A0A5M6IIU6_9PROT|nr:protein translocase subunit SecD [Roseospira marina]KAA5607528.1 protein translocase subunit SecD [Roseospira marina]MBB4312287.1 protein-export membrane protein SecD [Roseospira marina]MBB5085697.1 protein-export membrane protein SecD [Roseospira marina]